MPLLQPPNPNLHHAPGWTRPPLDGSLSVPEIFDFHHKHNPQHPVFIYEDKHSRTRVDITMAEFVEAAHKAGRIIGDAVGNALVTVLTSSDTITLFTTYLGLLRAGIKFQHISVRNSPTAIVHLIKLTSPSILLSSQDTPTQALARNVMDLLDDKDKPILGSLPVFEDIYNDELFNSLPARRGRDDFETTRVIAHSSGSTAFPKLINWTDQTMNQVFIGIWFSRVNVTAQIVAAHVPFTQASGMFWLFCLTGAGAVMSVFPPNTPLVASPDVIWDTGVAIKPAYIYAVPSFLEAWHRDPEKVAYIRSLRGISYGGASLPKSVGDYLVAQDCVVHNLIGSTELGFYSNFFPDSKGLDWEYIELPNGISCQMVELDDGGVFELVALSDTYFVPSVINSTHRGKPAYATSDLFVPHPTRNGLWKCIGRKDDWVVLSTGMKVSPRAIEEALTTLDPDNVHACVMFGTGRVQCGLLVQLTMSGDRDSVWTSVHKLNSMESTPSYARVFKEMIIFTTHDKPFTFNMKGYVRRVVALADYAQEIDAVYAGDVRATSLNEAIDIVTVRKVVHERMGSHVGDEDDLFESGCDSLHAIWIKNALVPTSMRNCVYEYPSIKALADYLSNSESNIEVETRQMVLDRLAPPIRTTVLLTGSTGSLGSAVLVKLLGGDVHKVYCVVRRSKDGSLMERQKRALDARGYDPRLAQDERVVLVGEDDISPGLMQDVTHVVHCAWWVDFNLTLKSYEGLLVWMRNLIDLAAGARFIFVSSISVSRLDESHHELGYAESKWVAEQILARSSLTYTTLRIGQISGGVNGAWNTTDWVPAIVKSGITIGFLPEMVGECDWVPLEDAAEAVVHHVFGHETGIVEVFGRRKQSLGELFGMIGRRLGLPMVSYELWIEHVKEDSSLDVEQVPVLKMMDFFEHHIRSAKGRGDGVLGQDKDFTDGDVEDWLQYWQAVGFMRLWDVQE